jgi:hypothetical protein
MRLGTHLRELSRLPLGVTISLAVALLAAVWSVAKIDLSPPRLTSRSLEMATAHAQVAVDTPKSAILDLSEGAFDVDGLKNRALLLGAVMASPPVRAYIAQRAHLSPDVLQIVAPRTPAQPRPTADIGRKKGPTDLLRSTDQYRLDIQSNPTVPVLDVYAQAPTARAAGELANAAVTGLGDYLAHLAASERTPRNLQVRLRQLGSARGEVINRGIDLQVALVTFLIVLSVACAACVVVARVRRGWLMAEAARS